MSVTRGSNDNKNNQGNQTGQDSAVFGGSFNQTSGSQNAGTAQPSGSNQGRSSGRAGIGRLLNIRTGVGRKRQAGELKAMLEAFGEEFKGYENNQILPDAQPYRLIMADRNRLNKKVDALIIALPVQYEGATHVAIHTLLLEDANDVYEANQWQIGGKQYRYSTVVGDVYDAPFWGQIVEIVREQSALNIIPYDASHQTLPAEMNITDKDAIHKIAFFVAEALTRTALAQILKTSADVFSLTDLGDSVNTTAAIDFRTVQDQTAAGLPLISEFAVKLRYSDNPQGGSAPNNAAKAFDLGNQIPLGGAEGFIDLSYSQPPVAQYGQQQMTQQYYAKAILTRLDTDQDVITPELQGLALLGATLIGRNMNWARTWSPQFRGLSSDLNDLGAIGYEIAGADGHAMGRLDTASSSFDDAALAKLVMAFIHPQPLISIDVEESGELTWLNRTLLDAAAGAPDANQALVQMFSNLTGGIFGQIWQGGEIIVDDMNRIHLGYYNADDSHNTRRDIRDLRYLPVLNRYAEQDPSMIEKWQATYDDVNVDAEVRLAEREDLIRKILGPTVRITGYARRLTFRPEFLDAALDAAAQAGLRIRPENTLINFGHTAVRGRANMADLAFGGQGGRQVFTQGSGANGGRNLARTFTGRGQGWGR